MDLRIHTILSISEWVKGYLEAGECLLVVVGDEIGGSQLTIDKRHFLW